MGGSHSCWRSSGTDQKTVKGNRPHDYTEINDDFLASEKPVALENGGAKADNNIEETYENCSSIIRASNLEPQKVEDKSPVKPASDRSVPTQPLAHILKEGAKPMTNGKKAKKVKPQPIPKAEKASESESGEARDQAPAFCLGNPSEAGHYQNVQPAMLKKPKPLPKTVKQESEEVGDVYAQVQKSKLKKDNPQHLNYIEVEFPKSPVTKENKIVINNKTEHPPTTYTDVIHKDGKIMLVSPSS